MCASSSTSSAGDIFSSSLQQQLFHRDKNSDSSHSASLPLPPHSTPLPPPSPLQAVNYIAFTEKVLMSLQTKWWKRNETNGEGRGELLNRDQKGVQTVTLGTISGFLFVIFLSVLYDLIRREKGEIPFFPVNTVGHPSHCAPFLPSLPSVCSSFSTAACFCLSFKLLFIMLYIPSHLIESILPCTVFGTFLLLKFRIPQRLPTPPTPAAPLIPSRMLLSLIVDQPSFSHVLNLFLTATITVKGFSLSFCGCS